MAPHPTYIVSALRKYSGVRSINYAGPSQNEAFAVRKELVENGCSVRVECWEGRERIMSATFSPE